MDDAGTIGGVGKKKGGAEHMERNGAALFAGAEDTMIRACVSGTMGKIYTNRAADPTAAQAVLGDFCFFVGEPSIAFAKTAAAEIITPMTKTWSRAIEAAWGAGVRRGERYALKKEPDVFDKAKLLRMADSAEPGYTFWTSCDKRPLPYRATSAFRWFFLAFQ